MHSTMWNELNKHNGAQHTRQSHSRHSVERVRKTDQYMKHSMNKVQITEHKKTQYGTGQKDNAMHITLWDRLRRHSNAQHTVEPIRKTKQCYGTSQEGKAMHSTIWNQSGRQSNAQHTMEPVRKTKRCASHYGTGQEDKAMRITLWNQSGRQSDAHHTVEPVSYTHLTLPTTVPV